MPALRDPRVDLEDVVLYALLIGIGIIPVAIAFITSATFGFDATLGLLMVALGVFGVALHVHRR